MAFTVAQFTDTHLAARIPEFSANFDLAAAHVRSAGADLVINTGDISLDGAEARGDLAVAVAAHDRIGLPYRLLPGNHDVGDDAADAGQPATPERQARWAEAVGPDHWSIDIPGWRLLGLNGMVLGTGLPEAAAQFAAATRAVSDLGQRALALFLHKPLYRAAPEETEAGYWYVHPAGRRALMGALNGVKPRLVASGHLHQHHEHRAEGMHHVWSPSLAFIVHDRVQEPIGTKLVGYMRHVFHGDGRHESALVRVEGLTLYDAVAMPHLYPKAA